MQQHLSCFRGMFALDGPTDPRREDSKRIPDVAYASPRHPSEIILISMPDGLQRFAMVIHPFSSISSEYLSVRYGEILEVIEQQGDHLKVKQFIEPKIIKHGFVYGKRCIMLHGKPRHSGISAQQSAEIDWSTYLYRKAGSGRHNRPKCRWGVDKSQHTSRSPRRL